MAGLGKNFSKNNDGFRKESDSYPTPYSITEQLFEVEKFNIKNSVLEPCHGEHKAIVKILEKTGFYHIESFDLNEGSDFLLYSEKIKHEYIVTNPPYSLAYEFIMKAKKIATKKIAMLLPLPYLHGQARLHNIWLDQEFPLSKVHVFSRYPMLGGELREDGKYTTGMQVYAWFIWDKSHNGAATIGWIDNQKFVISKKDL
jgi:hypothetical protein